LNSGVMLNGGAALEASKNFAIIGSIR